MLQPLKILSNIRAKECQMLRLYQSLSMENVAIAATCMNLTFECVKTLKAAPTSLGDNLQRAFEANTASLFTLAVNVIGEHIDDVSADSEQNPLIQQIRANERKLILELRDLAIEYPFVAAACCGLSEEQIQGLKSISSSELIEFCYREHKNGPLFKIRLNKDSSFIELVKIGSKPCFKNVAWLFDRVNV
jgi:hypothetical protein